MRTLQRRRARRGMYGTAAVAYPRTVNQIDKSLIGDKKTVNSNDAFEEEYERFIAEHKAVQQKKETEATAEPEVQNAPEATFIQTDMGEAPAPEVVEEVQPVSKKKKKTVEVSEEA